MSSERASERGARSHTCWLFSALRSRLRTYIAVRRLLQALVAIARFKALLAREKREAEKSR